MKNTPSARRLAENEVYFRERNAQIQKGFDEIKKIAEESGHEPEVFDAKTPLHFFCECSDEKCHERVLLSLEEYNTIHQNDKAFAIVCGHETKEFERLIDQKPHYCVVEKYAKPPASASKLNSTDLNNT